MLNVSPEVEPGGHMEHDFHRARHLSLLLRVPPFDGGQCVVGNSNSTAPGGPVSKPSPRRARQCAAFSSITGTHMMASLNGFLHSERIREVLEHRRQNLSMCNIFSSPLSSTHSENPGPHNDIAGLLNFLYKQKYPDGAPNQHASETNPRLFPETGKTVRRALLRLLELAWWPVATGLPDL